MPRNIGKHTGDWNSELSWILKVRANPETPPSKVVDGRYAYPKMAHDAYEVGPSISYRGRTGPRWGGCDPVPPWLHMPKNRKTRSWR